MYPSKVGCFPCQRGDKGSIEGVYVAISKKYLPQIDQAKRNRDYNKARELNDNYRWEMAEIEDTHRLLIQEKLVRKARRLMLPVPKERHVSMEEWENMEDPHEALEDENWRVSIFGEMLLKDHALTNLRREIRRKQKEKIDLYLPWISAITGLLGVILGILETVSTIQSFFGVDDGNLPMYPGEERITWRISSCPDLVNTLPM